MPNLLQRMLRWVAKRSAKWGGLPLRDPALVKMFGQGEDTSAGVDVNEKSAMTVSTVFACVRTISGSKGQSFVTMQENRKDGRKVAAESHPVHDLLLHEPNPEMSAFTFHETLQNHALTWGDGYAEIEWGTDNLPFALWPIHPQRVRPGRKPNGGVAYTVTADASTGEEEDQQERVIDSKDMFHVHGIGDDGLRGYPIVQHAREGIGLAMGAERFGGSLFGQGLNPCGVLEYPGELSEQAQHNLRESIENRHRSLVNAHRLMVLEEGMTFKQTSLPPEDAQFLQSREFQVVEICRWFDMPPHMVRDLSRATFSNIEHQTLEFLIFTMGPWFARWNAEYRRKLLTREERNRFSFVHDTSYLLKADRKTRYESYAVGRNAGFLSVNDIFREESMNLVPGPEGDALLVPVNMSVLGPKLLAEPPAEKNDSIAVTAMLTIMASVASNDLAIESAAAMLHVIDPLLSEAQINAMLTPYSKGRK